MLINNAVAELNSICLAGLQVIFSSAFYSTTKLNSVCGRSTRNKREHNLRASVPSRNNVFRILLNALKKKSNNNTD